MPLSRRDFFLTAAAGGALATGLWSADAIAQAGRPPEKAGRGEPRITEIKLYDIGRLLIHIQTEDRDIDGWGEVNTMPAAMSVGIARAFVPLLKDMNPLRIEYIWQLLFRAHRNVRGGMLHGSVIGGFDMALWDLAGKLLKQPVYALLGGPVRNRLRYYPHAKAFKETTQSMHGMVETPAAIDRIVQSVRNRREQLGSDGYLMFDGHGKFSPQVAIQVCKALEPFGLLYMEEVVPPEKIEDLAKVKAATTVPLCEGERLATIFPFRRLFELRCVDVLNPDVVRIGGISQLVKLAHIAEMYDIPLAPHGTHSALGTAATLHAMASVENFLIAEVYGHIIERAGFATGLPKPADGFYPLPEGPGLGVAVDERQVERLADDVERRGDSGIERAYFLPDGSVADR